MPNSGEKGMERMSEWKDTSSYSRNESDRTPKQWTLIFDGNRPLGIILHRHIYHPPDTWLFSCYDLGIEQHELQSKATEDAQREAVSVVQATLTRHLAAVKSHVAADRKRIREIKPAGVRE